MLVVVVHSLLFLWCWLLFFIHCFSTSSLTLPWAIARFLYPFYTFSPAYRRVIRDTSILTFPSSSFTVLSPALWLWVGIFYPQMFFILCSFIHIFSHNLLLSRFPWEPAVLPWSLQGFMLILEVQTWPMWLFDSQQSDYLIHSNPQSWYSKEFIFKAYQILPWITCGKNFSYLLFTRFELFLLVQSIC